MLYQRMYKITSLDTIEFLETRMYKQSTLTNQWNYNIFEQILYRYFRYTGRLFLGLLLLLLAVTLSEFHEKPR